VRKNQILILTTSLTFILILVAAGIYFSIDSSPAGMDGMMGDGSTANNNWIISLILIAAAIVVSIGLIIYFAYPKDGKSEGTRRATLSNIKTQKIKGRLPTGHKKLDTLLYGGVPPKFAVALTMPINDYGNQLIEKFVETGAKNNEITFYITIDPSFATELARKFPSNFYLFVANPQTKILLEKAPNVFALNGIENLTEINIILTKVFRKTEPTQKSPRRICINIISDVLLEHGSVLTRKWLSELIVAMKSEGFTILAVMNPQMHSSEEVQSILGIFDGEINISEREFRSFLKIKRMSSQRYLKNEIELSED
jgi:KaiC/GvpD/RAD55 family RecA-like ATPase